MKLDGASEPRKPPVVLTFMAPAAQCNQRCPACILDRTGEPVRSFDLGPTDYACFLEHFVQAEVPILSVGFQGYEVTLSRSWPYVEAVLGLAKHHGLRRSFITNGMLLSKWTERIVALDPHRIAVSLDGASAPINDTLRGLVGAFDATIASLGRFLAAAPAYADRVCIVSTLYNEANARSFLDMPRLLNDLGIKRWAINFEADVRTGRQRPVQPYDVLVDWIRPLSEAARARGIRFHTNDEMGFFTDRQTPDPILRARRIYDPRFLCRLEPAGFVRVGHEVAETWDPLRARRWDPRLSAVETVGYWQELQVVAPKSYCPERSDSDAAHPSGASGTL